MCSRCKINERYKDSGWCLNCINQSRKENYPKKRLFASQLTAEQIALMKLKRREYQRSYILENPEKTRQTRIKSYRKRSREIKEAVWNLYGSKCDCCGNIDAEILELNHLFGGGTQERKSKRHFQLWRELEKGIADKNLYNLLCPNCHKRFTLGLECKHG